MKTTLAQQLIKLQYPEPGQRRRLKERLMSVQIDSRTEKLSDNNNIAEQWRVEAKFGMNLSLPADNLGARLATIKLVRDATLDAVYGEVRSQLLEMVEDICSLRDSQDREVWDIAAKLQDRLSGILDSMIV